MSSQKNANPLNQMPVISPDGTPGVIPHEDWANAHSQGFKQAVFATSPDGKLGVLHPEDVQSAVKQGFHLGQPTTQVERDGESVGQMLNRTLVHPFKEDLDVQQNGSLWDKTKQAVSRGLNPLSNPAVRGIGNLVAEGGEQVRNLIDAQTEKVQGDNSLVAKAQRNIIAPAAKAGARFLSGMAQPESIATLGAFKAAPVAGMAGKVVRAGAGLKFGVPAAKESIQSGTQAVEQAAQGNVPEAVELGTDAAINALFAGETLGGTARELPRSPQQAVELAKQTGSAIVRATPDAIATRLPEALQSDQQIAKKEARQVRKQSDNLSSALEMGGKPGKGVVTNEEIAQPIVDEVRAEAARQGKTDKDFDGRNGYVAGKEVTEGVRKRYDAAYDSLIDPIRGEVASEASRAAANEVLNRMLGDAALMDEIKRGTPDGTNVQQLQNIAGAIRNARTVGELDAARVALNRLVAPFEGKTEGQQYVSPLVQQSMSQGANAIRSALYEDIAQRYGGMTVNGESTGITAEQIRELQREHGAAIQADNLMSQTMRELSSSASAEGAKPAWWRVFARLGYRATMGSRSHAAAGVLEKILAGSDLDLYNTRMKRVIKGATPEDGRQFPTPPITPEYVDVNEVPDTRTSPVRPQLPAGPQNLEPTAPMGVLPGLLPGGSNPRLLKPGNAGRLPQGSTPNPRRALPPIALFTQSTVPQSNQVEAVGIPETAEGAALRQRYEQRPVSVIPGVRGLAQSSEAARVATQPVETSRNTEQPRNSIDLNANRQQYDEVMGGNLSEDTANLFRDAIAVDARVASKAGIKPNPRSAIRGVLRDLGVGEGQQDAKIAEILRRVSGDPSAPSVQESPVSAKPEQAQEVNSSLSEAEALRDLHRTYGVTESHLKQAVEQAGLVYNGIMDTSISRNGLQVFVTDPQTKSTYTLKVDDVLEPDALGKALEKKRYEFANPQIQPGLPLSEETPKPVGLDKRMKNPQLVDVPVDDPRLIHENAIGTPDVTPDASKVVKYAKMPAETATPIEVVPGRGEANGRLVITDGWNRWEAAKQRGDKTIKAWVPEGTDVTPSSAGMTAEQFVNSLGMEAPEVELREPGVTQNNGSAYGADSLEAQGRLASENRQGQKWVRVDTRDGREYPVAQTVDTVNLQPGKYDILEKRGPNGEVVDAKVGELARTLAARGASKSLQAEAGKLESADAETVANLLTDRENTANVPQGRVGEVRQATARPTEADHQGSANGGVRGTAEPAREPQVSRPAEKRDAGAVEPWQNQKDFNRHVSSLAPKNGAWSADIYDGNTELLMPGTSEPFTINGRTYSWHQSSHKIHGKSMPMSNQLVAIGPDGLIGKYSIGTLGAEKQAIQAALRDIRKDVAEHATSRPAEAGKPEAVSPLPALRGKGKAKKASSPIPALRAKGATVEKVAEGVTKIETPSPKLERKSELERKAINEGAKKLAPPANVPQVGRNFEGRYVIAALEPVKQAWIKMVNGKGDGQELYDWMVKQERRSGMSRPDAYKDDKLFIKVPGDGSFLIENTPVSIEHALKAAKKFAPVPHKEPAPKQFKMPKPTEEDRVRYERTLKDEITELERLQSTVEWKLKDKAEAPAKVEELTRLANTLLDEQEKAWNKGHNRKAREIGEQHDIALARLKSAEEARDYTPELTMQEIEDRLTVAREALNDIPQIEPAQAKHTSSSPIPALRRNRKGN